MKFAGIDVNGKKRSFFIDENIDELHRKFSFMFESDEVDNLEDDEIDFVEESMKSENVIVSKSKYFND